MIILEDLSEIMEQKRNQSLLFQSHVCMLSFSSTCLTPTISCLSLSFPCPLLLLLLQEKAKVEEEGENSIYLLLFFPQCK